jgi:hypothetical protein
MRCVLWNAANGVIGVAGMFARGQFTNSANSDGRLDLFRRAGLRIGPFFCLLGTLNGGGELALDTHEGLASQQ